MIVSDMLLTFPHQFSSLTIPTNMQMLEKARPPRCAELCAVCGDQSTGYHYEVPSCNGCKTFFRRTIVSERTFKCHKNGNCLFTKDIRCACRSCRFKKCLEVGMNPKAIQTSRPGFLSKETSPNSISPEPSCSRKRAYDISSLLDMQASCSNANGCSNSNTVSRSASPEGAEVPTASAQYRWKCIDKESSQRTEEILRLEDRVDFLRKSTFTATSSLLDVLTRPCALDDVSRYEPSPLHFVSNEVDFDKETNFAIEYMKSFKWFRDFGFTDKYTLICERTPLLVTFRLAFKRANQLVDINDQYSNSLESAVNAVRRMELDRTTFALINAIILLDCDNLALSNAAKDTLMKEKQRFMDALAVQIFQKNIASAAGRLADRVSLLWTILKASANLKSDIIRILPTNTLTRQLIEVANL